MDRQKLDLLTAQANALGTALCAVSDTNDNARQRCLNFAAEVRSFVKGWNNLSKALHDPQLESRPAFTQITDRVLQDCSKIVNDLRSQLADVRTKQSQYDAAVRGKRWMPRNKTPHLLVSFLGRETTALRQQQIFYANSVLDVLLGVVFHAKTLGEHNTRLEAQASFQDQLARLRAEAESRARVFKEERRIGDKYIVSSLWLSTVTWHADSFEAPPFETLALQWFKIVPNDGQSRHRSSTMNTSNLTRIVMQLQQDLREQSQTHQRQVQEHRQQHDALRTWAEGTIGQLEFSQQKAAREAASQMEEMKSQLEVQKQKIDSDAITIEQLKHSRSEWTAHYQKQSALLEQLEGQMRELKKENVALKRSYIQQQQKLDELLPRHEKLQQSHSKLQQQNHALRERLGEIEVDRKATEEKNSKLQARYSKAVEHNRRWRELYEEGPGERDAQIRQLQSDIQAFKGEVATLKSDLADVTGDRNQLHDSLKRIASERDTERLHNSRLQERLSTRKSEPPSAYDARSSRRRSRSRSRSDSTVPSKTSRSASKESASGASSSTYVDDSASDYEHYASNLPRRVSNESSSKIGSWFSPRRTLVVSGR